MPCPAVCLPAVCLLHRTHRHALHPPPACSWVTVGSDLKFDAERDLSDVGGESTGLICFERCRRPAAVCCPASAADLTSTESTSPATPPRSQAAADLPLHALTKLPYGKLAGHKIGVREGVLFLTYSALIASTGGWAVWESARSGGGQQLGGQSLRCIPPLSLPCAPATPPPPPPGPTQTRPATDTGRTRFRQLLEWCGPDFDGLLVFDESEYK